MLLRRLIASLLLLAPVQGSAAAIVANAGDAHGHGRCTDHVCACVRKCSPARKAAKSCHGPDEPAGSLLKAAGCHHGTDAVGPAATRPHVLPFGVVLSPGHAPAGLAGPADTHRLVGYLEIDIPPPRRSS